MRIAAAFLGIVLWLALSSPGEPGSGSAFAGSAGTGSAGILPAYAAATLMQSRSPAEQLTQHAAELMQRGELKTAETELRRAVELAPNNVDALALLGGALGMQGQLEESNRIFEKALRLAPGNQDLRRNLAANQVRLGRFSAAASNLQTILKANPGDRESILMLGFVRAREGKYSQAVTYLEKVPELVRQDPDRMAALARAYYGVGKKQNARDWLTQLNRLSTNPAAFYLGGQVAMEGNDWETADGLFLAAKNAGYPKTAMLNYQLARVRYETGRYREGRELLEPIANSPDSNGTVLNLLAWCYLKEGDEATGLKILSFATDRFPDEAGNFLDLGRLQLKAKKLDSALDVVRRGTERHPDSQPLFQLKGELETAQGLHAQAVQSFERAVQLDSRSHDALLGLALAQTNLLKHQDAVATFEKGLKLFPSDARFYAEYGKVLLLPWASAGSSGAAEKAEQLLRRAVELDGSRADARFELGNQLVKTGRAAEAVPHLEKATSLDPHNAQTHFVLARAYRSVGRAQDADREMQLFEKLR